jgi:Ca-activated chloride channel family protein
LYSDDFSGGLSAWQAGEGTWTIESGRLHGFYTHVCGSPGCPQGDLYLKNVTLSPGQDWLMEVEFTWSQYPDSTFYYAPADFVLWQDSSHKERYTVAYGGDGWNGAARSDIGYSRGYWTTSWSQPSSDSGWASVTWDPKVWNTLSLQKRGSLYSLFLNDKLLRTYVGSNITGAFKPGLHAYGNYFYDNFRVYATTGASPTSLYAVIDQVDPSMCPSIKLLTTVTDGQGQPVTGLTASNFSLKEDGQSRPISLRSAGQAVAALSLALLIDSSSSLSSADLQSEKDATKGLVAQLAVTDQVAVYDFDSLGTLREDFTANRTAITAAIEASTNNGNTRLYDAVVAAAQAIAGRFGRRAIVVMTDGEDTSSSATLTQAINAARQAGAPVFTVGFGSANSSLLTQIANETGGLFVWAATGAGLQSILQAIGPTLANQYEISYTTADNAVSHNIELTVTSGGQSATATRTVAACQPTTGGVTIDIQDAGGAPGGTVDVAVTMTAATTSPVSFQFDVTYNTAKLTFVSAARGSTLTTAGKDVSTNQLSSGKIRVLAAGLNQSTIGNGVALTLRFSLAASFKNGSTPLSASNGQSAGSNGEPLTTTTSDGTVTALGCTCDVNQDGGVNVSDVVLIINQALGVSPATCDLNRDGSVNVSDVVLVINAALGLGCVQPASVAGCSACLHRSDVQALAGAVVSTPGAVEDGPQLLLPLVVETTGAAAAGIQFSLVFDSRTLRLEKIEPSPGLLQARKGIRIHEAGHGEVNVVVAGLNRETISDGPLALAVFSRQAGGEKTAIQVQDVAASDRDGRAIKSRGHSPRPDGQNLFVYGHSVGGRRMVILQGDFSEPVDLYLRQIGSDAQAGPRDRRILAGVSGRVERQLLLPEGGRLLVLAVRAGADPDDERSHVEVRAVGH